MTVRPAHLFAAAGALLLIPTVAGAEDDGYSLGDPFAPAGLSGTEIVSVEIGGGYASEDSFKFGEYTGLEKEDFFLVGNVDTLIRDESEDGSAMYFDLSGRNLGLESRGFDLRLGSQGVAGGELHYQKIPHFLIEDALTPYRGEGSDNLTLPPTWPAIGAVGAPNTPAAMPLSSSLRAIDIENERERTGASLFWLPMRNWRFDVDYRNEIRDGTRTTYGLFGENGGNPAAAALPEPINYEVNEVDATAAYSGKKLQLQASYTASIFTNRNNSLTWANAYTGGQPSGGAWPDIPDEGRMALDPDNQSHNFALSGGYTLTPTTRLTGSLSYGVMLQDEDFLPYTINPDVAPALALPRRSLEGKINIFRADIGVSTRPMTDLGLSARYRFQDRDNATPQDNFARVINDTSPQNAATELRTNLPHSYTRHVVNLDADYRLRQDTTLAVGYEFERIDRTFSERERTDEHTAHAKVRAQPLDNVSGWLSFAYATRGGDGYDSNAQFLAGHPLESAPTFEDLPALRKFHLSDRDRYDTRGGVTVTPTDRVSVGLTLGYTVDDYNDVEFGVTQTDRFTSTVDLSYDPVEHLTTYAFYTFDQLTYDQDGRAWQGSSPATALDPTRNWSVETQDRVHTLGLGATWAAIPDRLDITADYAYSQARTAYDIDAGSTLTSSPLPDLETTVHSVQLVGDYKLMRTTSLRLGYRFERLDTDDFALDGIAPDSSSNTLLFGNSAPNYTAHVVTVSTTIKF